jgi:uncharacterized C2H2 Zn-finger protein
MDQKGVMSLDELVRQKQRLSQDMGRLAQAEQALIKTINQTLSHVGYRVVLADGHHPASNRAGANRRALPKHLKCPKCDRRFSLQMHVARHINATHRKADVARKTRSQKVAK